MHSHSDSFSSTYILNHGHPNLARWQRAIDGAVLRGELVASILERHIDLRNSLILDIGAGVGGTSVVLKRRGAQVTAVDNDTARIRAIRALGAGIQCEEADASIMPFAAGSFDAAVLQDVIEHCFDPVRVLSETYRVLKEGGVAYISTPNRISPFTVMSDPHWGMPFAGLLRRPKLRKVLRFLRPSDADRADIAQLLSFEELQRMLVSAGFSPILHTTDVLSTLFLETRSVVWSSFHIAMISVARRLRLQIILTSIVNDRPGLINRFIAPSWHMICVKGQP